MHNEVREHHQRLWGSGPELIVQAPGRINIIGEHLDYHGGRVLPAAIDKAIYVSLERAPGSTEVFSLDRDSWFREGNVESAGWSGYLSHLMAIATEQELAIEPFRGVIKSSLPVGAGLSSSAALTSAFILGLDHLFAWHLTKVEMAEFGQAIEHALGVMCGIMDQYAVLHGRRDHVICLDCLHTTHTYFTAELGDANFYLLHSGVSHNLAESAYNDRRRETYAGLLTIRDQFPQVETYRDVDHQIIERTHALTEEQVRLANYIVEEMARVSQATKALGAQDLSKVGDLLFASHAGLREQYEVTCDETDLLVDLAASSSEVYGARQMGGGFGGCVLLLSRSPDAVDQIARKYSTKTGIETTPMLVQLADGARCV